MTDITRGEFDMLSRMVSEGSHRIDAIDVSGTRGVGVLQQQITDLAKDVAGVTVRIDKHEEEHVREARARIVSRRWAVGMGVAALSAVEGPLAYLIAHLHG